MSQPTTADWFQSPQGADYPIQLYKRCCSWRKCFLIIDLAGDNIQINAKSQVILDSQQPFLAICLENKDQGEVIFPFQGIHLNCGIEGDAADTDNWIDNKRATYSLLPKNEKFYYYVVRCKSSPVFTKVQRPLMSEELEEKLRTLRNINWLNCDLVILLQYRSSFTDVPLMLNWSIKLYNLVHQGSEGEGFWYYRQNPESDVTKRHPEMPWLWTSTEGRREYMKWKPHNPLFFDDNDRICRLLKASKNERYQQQREVSDVFNPTRCHEAWCTESDFGLPGSTHLVHIKLLPVRPSDNVVIPKLQEGAKVHFEWALQGVPYGMDSKLIDQGAVTQSDSNADLVLRVTGQATQALGERFPIVTSAVANTMPIDAQIEALGEASKLALVFGDRSGNEGQGFSLRRTLLAHGTELEQGNQGYFTLDVRQMSPVPPNLQQERVEYLSHIFRLDEAQKEAFQASLVKIVCGVSLIQGPPGTGKTSTAKAIICTAAALGCKILLVAGSNKGVDNLAEAVTKALQRDKRLQSWCGQLVRFRTPRYQLERARGGEPSDENDNLSNVQAHVLTIQYAQDHATTDKYARSLLERLAADKQRRLSREERKGLKGDYEHCVMKVLQNAKIVATTLSNASQDLLRRSGFEPAFVVCDEAGQCQEGEITIALTIPSTRVMVLIGDPEQLPPTVVSEHATNEGALYLKRSMMERLHEAGYPCTMLLTNYRSHSHIFDIFNRLIYKGALRLGPNNDSEQRVGKVWDAFTRSHHHFCGYGVVGVRRLFISVIGEAVRAEGSQSWSNQSQGMVAVHLLKNLYAYRTSDGQSIRPEDVMVISPYAAQRALVGRLMGEHGVSCRDNLTVDASQGQEAPMVIFMLTKPSRDAASVGFIADQQRLNVALSRAREVLVIVGNLLVWNRETLDKIEKSLGKKARFLLNLLFDVSKRNHTMVWKGEATVEDKKPVGPVEYKCPDRFVPPFYETAAVPSAPVSSALLPARTPQRPAQASSGSFSTAPWRPSARSVPGVEGRETLSRPTPRVNMPVGSSWQAPVVRLPTSTSQSRDIEEDVSMVDIEKPEGRDLVQQTGSPPSPVLPPRHARQRSRSPPHREATYREATYRERPRSPSRAIDNRLLTRGGLPQVSLVPRDNFDSIPVEELERQFRLSRAAEEMAAATLRRTLIEEELRVRGDWDSRNRDDQRDGR
ncbi:P-loop containing nucleoside triphosphate hydrolase protein [Aspergillus welwitschiae]|uniref:P-loop containing nucleoside triphosphate hydrolase protein n=1 Tax=Aspergillus welwitschiae TaxID=1341132 RepID=A0A3F3QB72_9EURO|nr:P-loop containing nucleoside triphosphate hydrolase protein [Aspergillus welwitschiae]RDH36405.1 P-loop containing nucleoside triphosphate hydrolase protein [Aspergillus welwitschiae]